MSSKSTMISLRFEKPRKKYNSTVLSLPPVNLQQSPSFSYESLAIQDSSKKGITVSEWKRADAIIKTQAAICKVRAGETFYPPNLEDYLKYGKCMVIGVDRDLVSIQKWDSIVWDDDMRTPYIIHARTTEKTPVQFFTCTANYPAFQPPIIPELSETVQPTC